jgi:predicted nucleotidyltransferase
MNNNLLLYGSFARGDSSSESDMDLLTVIKGHSYKAVYNKINISYYNRDKLIEMATSGSLFVFHLNRESRILTDEDNLLSDIIFGKFILRQNYVEDIRFGKTLLNDIFNNYDDIDNYAYANSKVSWCLRTIYSGIGADQNQALFSKEKIAAYFGKETSKFLEIKNLTNYQKKLVSKIIRETDKLLSHPLTINEPFRSDLMIFRNDVNRKLYKCQQDEFDGY